MQATTQSLIQNPDITRVYLKLFSSSTWHPVLNTDSFSPAKMKLGQNLSSISLLSQDNGTGYWVSSQRATKLEVGEPDSNS